MVSMGIACFGPLDLNKDSKLYGSITSTPKLEWQDTHLLKMLLEGIKDEKKSKQFKVVFDTDCNVLAKFELEHGGHKGVKDNLAYITVGTGVGVGYIINGQYIHGLIHPEGGHVSIPRNEKDLKNYPKFKGVCAFHKDTCVEGLCSNVSIKERLGLKDVDDVKDLPDNHVIWEIIGDYLGTMCANLCLTISLEKIVIGGGVMMRGEPLMKHIHKSFLSRLNSYLKHSKLTESGVKDYIVRSQFKNDLGLVSSAAVGATGEVYGHKKL